jgi:hypothetical protein
MRRWYIGLAVVGVVVPYALFTPWMMDNGFPVGVVLELWFANEVTTFFAADLLLTTMVFVVFVLHDSKRLGVRRWYLPLILTFTVGLAFAFPIYLWMRTDQIQEEVKQ